MYNIIEHLSKDFLELIGDLAIDQIKERKSESVDYINKTFAKRETLRKVIDYINNVWFDSCLCFFRVQEKIGYFK